MHYSFKPSGVCSTKIDFDIEDGKLRNVAFQSGCSGNLKAIGLLVEGQDAKDIAATLKGNACGYKNTSCADQLSRAIMQAISKG